MDVCKLYPVTMCFKIFPKTPCYCASRNILSQLSFASLTFIRCFLARNTTSVLGGENTNPSVKSANWWVVLLSEVLWANVRQFATRTIRSQSENTEIIAQFFSQSNYFLKEKVSLTTVVNRNQNHLFIVDRVSRELQSSGHSMQSWFSNHNKHKLPSARLARNKKVWQQTLVANLETSCHIYWFELKP